MIINGSPDITLLEVAVTWDISGNSPLISIENQSAGSGLANVSWWFVAKSPTNTPIHEGSEANPDETGIWTSAVLADSWPRPFNQIEWSGAPYTLVVYAKDSSGNIYTIDKSVSICRPTGNTSVSRTTFGRASTKLEVKCQQARIYFQNETNHSYKGMDGTIVSSVLRVIFPLDETATIPAPFSISNFSAALVPISYSSKNYQFLAIQIYDYDFGNNTHLIIRYQQLETFGVFCNIDLMPLVCEYEKLIDDVENGNCSDVAAANRKLALINSKMALVGIGMSQPLTGIDVQALIKEIEAIGNFTCNCCDAPTGIIPQTASVIDGFTFDIVTECGDIGGTVEQVGTNIQFLLHDKKYVFKVCENSPMDTTAFTISDAVSGDDCTKTYCLLVNVTQLSFDILNNIKTNADLVNLFNSIVIQGSNISLAVDGGCIFQSSSAFDYGFDLVNIPINTTFALLTSVIKNAVVQPLFFQFNLTNLATLQTYLNGLGIGTFVVTNPSGQNVHIASTANPNNLTSLTYKISATTFVATQTSTAAGYIALSANQVVQYIINYLCNLDDSQLVTSQSYSICYIDPTTKLKVITVVAAGTALNDLLAIIATGSCNTATYITSLGAVTCAAIQAAFPQSVNIMGATDFVLGTKGGACARIFPVELGTRILTLGYFDADFRAAFCALVELCGGGLPCDPYTVFQVAVVAFDQSCPTISDFNSLNAVDGSTITVTKVIFGNTPTSAQTITVEYKLQSDSSYILLSSTQAIATDGTPLTTITIPTAPGQTYDIRLSNNCGSPVVSFVKSITTPGSPTDTLFLSNGYGSGGDPTIERVGFGGFGPSDFVFEGPVLFNSSAQGVHPAFTGAISVELSGTFSPVGTLRILVNGVQQECITIAAPGTFTFASDSYLVTDEIDINLLDDGPCI